MTTDLSSFNLSVGQAIKQKRLEHKLTQTKLGEKCDVTFQQIQKYESGKNGCSGFRLYELAEILKVNITYFYNYTPTPLILTKEMEVKND